MKKKLLIAGISFISLFFSTKGIAQVPTASFAVSSNTVCPGAVISFTDFSSDTPTSWSYTLGSPTNTTSVQDPTVSFATGGTYVITLQAANGSGTSTPYSQTITVNPSPTLSIAGATNVCQGSTPSYTASGASSYLWSTGAITSTVSIPNIINSSILTVTGTSAFGCTRTLTILMNVSTLPIVGIFATNSVICNGSSVALGGTGATTYTWTGGVNNGAAFTPTVTQTYSVVGTSTNTGCTSTNVAAVTITVNPLPVVSVSNFTICSGSTVTLSPTGASTYTFSNGSSTIAPTSNTIVNVSGTNSLGCTSSVSAVSSITVNAAPTVSVNSGSICAGTIFTMIPSGASTYTFSNGSSTVNPTTNTSYSVTGTGANGCVSPNMAVSSVTVNASPTIAVNSGSICAGTIFTMIPTGASTYTFSNGNSIVNPTSNTSYSVTGTGANGCVSPNMAVSSVTVNASPTIAVNSGSICSGTIFTMIPSGASTYTFSNGSSTVNPTANTSYSVTGTSALGCIGSNTAVSSVTVNAIPTVAVNSGSICSGSVFTIVPTGAATYIFSNGSSTVSPTVNTSYSVTGTSAAGCVGSNTAVSSVTVNSIPVLSIALSSSVICAGNSSTLTASGAATYTWNTTATTATISVSPSTTTGYTLNGTSSAGCVASAPAVTSLSVNSQSAISASGSSICPGATATLSPSGATTYTYVTGTTTLTGTSVTVSPVATTIYTVSGTNSNGCISTGTNIATTTIVALVSPSLTIVANPTAVCSGATSSLTVTGANTYTWTTPASNATQIAVNPTSTTVYTVIGTGSTVCNGVRTITLTVLATPTITVNSGTICSGYNFTLAGSGASTYTFANATNTITNVVSPLTLTNYSVIGTSAQGCISNTLTPAVSTVAVNASPVITAANGTVCSGLSYNILPTGANTYSINGVSASTLGLVTPVTTTTYSVTGTGTNNCVSPIASVVSVTVVANPSLVVASTPSAICVGQATAVLSATGANTYSWNTSATTSTTSVSPSATTIYTVTGISSVGCISTETVSLVVNALPVVAITANTNFICVGQTATLTASGANTYVWNTTSTTTAIAVNPIVNTNYTVTGTSNLGCTRSATTAIQVNTLALSVSQNTTVCFGSNITITAGGANSYTWTGNFQFASYPLTPTASAVYTVNGTDVNGCILTKTVSVNVFQLPNVTSTISSTLICIGESATLTAGGASTYAWMNGTTSVSGSSIIVTPTINLLQTYVVTGTDNNNCTATSTKTLSVNLCLGVDKNSVTVNESSVYPNPNNGEFFVNVTSTSTILILNNLGQVIENKQLESGVHHFDYANYSAGVYFVKITQGNSSKTIKMLKN
jgi:hypothetical protein